MKRTLIILCILVAGLKAATQVNPVFQHLNTSNGLSYIGVHDMCTDKKGNLWVGTGNGLNMFNGRTVEKYFATEYPEMQNSSAIHVTCDSSNRIWILTSGGHVAVLDEKRQMHRVAIYEQNEYVNILWILNSSRYGIVLYTAKGNYVFKKESDWKQDDSLTKQQFNFLPIKGFHELNIKGRSRIIAYDEEYYLLMHQDVFLKVRYSNNTVDKKYDFPALTALIKWQSNNLLAYDGNTGDLKSINLDTEEVTYPFSGMADQYGRVVKATFNACVRLSNDRYIFTTSEKGLYVYNAVTHKIYNHRHRIEDPSSINNDHATNVAAGQKGWVFVSCVPAGISYFNADDIIGSQTIFTDNKGNGYDGYIQGIATKDNDTYYLGTVKGLLEWKRSVNSTVFIDVEDKNGHSLFAGREATSIVMDRYDRIWISALDRGIIVIDKNRNLVKHFIYEPGTKNGLKMMRVARLIMGPDGFIWACGRLGFCRINPATFEIDNLRNTPLQQLDTIPVVPLFFQDKTNLWIATSFRGLYHYNLTTKMLTEFKDFSPYAREGILDFKVDKNGVLYIANAKGLRIFYPGGRMKQFTQKDGLLIDRAEGILVDDHGRVWIGNDIGLACYNPADSSLRAFDVRYGLSIYGFRVGSYIRTPNREFALGTPRGFQYFHPDSLYNKRISLNVQISKIETEQLTSSITGNSIFNLSAKDHQVTFHFSSVDFSPHLRTFYECRLTDIDDDWVKIADQNSIRYNSLPPGEYNFKVRVSNDNRSWQEADNEVTIIIAAPFYQTSWFKLAGALLGLSLLWLVTNYYRNKQTRQREALETELVITQFALQINRHKNEEELFWDVTRNCISKLKFEDCVIYVKESGKNVLIQKAAYGPKNPVDFTIHQPIEIPVGKGIVGTVAQTGKPEMVSDTAHDNRYIVDDERRNSELAVPIIIDGRVVGVIDSEHPKKNFFSARHLQILSAVAALSANQLQSIRAEQEKQKASLELLENKRKAMESRLQSLRLQMNPHFLFNALNSIQQMILANEEMVATRYLSRFSKLLRTILVHSDKEMVTLKEELEILNLYVELEAIRFKDSFQYKIECEEEIDEDEVKLPTLLIQPFVENAIWHGLMHKEGQRKLLIRFSEQDDNLVCIIEDNGIGRDKAREAAIASGQGKNHTSKGIAVSLERLKTLQGSNGHSGSLNIVDLKNETGQPAGTRVEINFPIQN